MSSGQAPRIQVTPDDSVSFGPSATLPASETVTIKNTGTGVLRITNVKFTNTSSPFVFSNLPSRPFEIQSNASEDFQIKFQTSQPGSYESKLEIESNDSQKPKYELKVKGEYNREGGEPRPAPAETTTPEKNMEAFYKLIEVTSFNSGHAELMPHTFQSNVKASVPKEWQIRDKGNLIFLEPRDFNALVEINNRGNIALDDSFASTTDLPNVIDKDTLDSFNFKNMPAKAALIDYEHRRPDEVTIRTKRATISFQKGNVIYEVFYDAEDSWYNRYVRDYIDILNSIEITS